MSIRLRRYSFVGHRKGDHELFSFMQAFFVKVSQQLVGISQRSTYQVSPKVLVLSSCR